MKASPLFLYKLIGRLPLPVLYGFASFCTFLFYYLIPYRKKVIQGNMKKSFPTLSDKELGKLTYQFYGYLTDQLVEFFKGVSISKDEMLDRFEIKNEDVVTDFIKKGIPVILVAGHQGNWEWAIHRLALSKNPHDVIYQKLNNPTFNEFTKQVRSRFGHVVLLEKRESVLLTRERKDIPRVICLAADQAPQKPESAYWTNFLHQDTAFFTGMERFARDYQYPVVFAELIRKKRGKYTMTYELLANVPFDELAPGEIIERFARRLEKSINAYPEQYLWSHRRWKHSKPEKLSLKWS
ncbi:lysophospholipid acyltransferase family protein [Aquirufa lenticrescens]|uniref:lysophospholipid acyltransferase family protein n=1 Tax=Aquirufa lenticrescens TaxID=2696560 RepID=UPI001CAA7965|nr:lysophospholipid acyltransferase family protein [Aquirufa lenticrescens]UAJ15050.1 lipid A biosynthesis acyltransferase [Aquirufa lenticrescens]